ncbi:MULTISPECIES: hypothetical protein [unclassified Thioalkalivibrio]|uniref:hypothetical protein n=1 Tax=unclassified Thioalkalivibrio TaxID=2621013 RepID=UPI00036D0DC0|nr:MULTISPECIES: hypothetical protein [unclassified Thioalkalivibrio]
MKTILNRLNPFSSGASANTSGADETGVMGPSQDQDPATEKSSKILLRERIAESVAHESSDQEAHGAPTPSSGHEAGTGAEKDDADYGGSVLAGAAAIGAVAALSAAPKKAEAASLDLIGEMVLAFFEGPFQSMVDAFLGDMTDVFEQSGDQTAASIGEAADSIIDTMIKQTNSEIYRATEPSPMRCMSDSAAKANMESTAKARAMHRSRSRNKARAVVQKDPNDTHSRRESLVSLHRSRRGTQYEGEDISAGNLLDGDLDDNSLREAAEAFIDNAEGQLPDMAPRIPEEREETGRGEMYTGAQLTHAARLSIASESLDRILTNRVSADSDTPSLMKTFEHEISRTYGSEDWRNEVAIKAHAAPLVKESLYLTAFQNRMLLEQIRQNDSTLALLAVQTLEQLEGSGRSASLGSGRAATRRLEPVN